MRKEPHLMALSAIRSKGLKVSTEPGRQLGLAYCQARGTIFMNYVSINQYGDILKVNQDQLWKL